MKLWQTSGDLNKMVEDFTIGRDTEFDIHLASHDIIGSLAHIQMLTAAGLLGEDEHIRLRKSLLTYLNEAKSGDFIIGKGVEDIHSQVEKRLTEDLGELGMKIHTARSRNDQVLVDLRMYFREVMEDIVELSGKLFDRLMNLSEKHSDDLMPGYTHMQVGMVSSFGLWFSAFAENLVDDLRMLETVYEIVNQNPLGSGAGYGSSLPIDRQMTTRLLGFRELSYNSIHAQMGRGRTEWHIAVGMAGFAQTLSKLSMDICLFVNENHRFISFPKALTTGSSIMPHKKNPDVFELIRSQCNLIQTLPSQITAVTSNLGSGYHRDFQMLKELIFPSIESLKSCLTMMEFSLGYISIRQNILNDEKYKYLFSVEEVNKLVKQGVPFREAYRQVAASIEDGSFRTDRKIRHTHQGSINHLCLADIRNKWRGVMSKFPFEDVRSAIAELTEQ